jgi:hypothetical protein
VKLIGAAVSASVGASEGTSVGASVGASVGESVGASVGDFVGTFVGALEGVFVSAVLVGESVGTSVGADVGASEGAALQIGWRSMCGLPDEWMLKRRPVIPPLDLQTFGLSFSSSGLVCDMAHWQLQEIPQHESSARLRETAAVLHSLSEVINS